MAYCGPRGIALDDFLRWSAHSQQAALDWAAYEGRRCKNCGIHPDDVEEGAFHAHLEQCKGCQARQRVEETKESKEGRGVYVVARPWSAPNCPRCKPMDD